MCSAEQVFTKRWWNILTIFILSTCLFSFASVERETKDRIKCKRWNKLFLTLSHFTAFECVRVLIYHFQVHHCVIHADEVQCDAAVCLSFCFCSAEHTLMWPPVQILQTRMDGVDVSTAFSLLQTAIVPASGCTLMRFVVWLRFSEFDFILKVVILIQK